MLLEIRHSNIYRYSRPVELTTHRLMLRPAESHGLQIRSGSIEISPAHTLSWEHDVFYNSIAQVTFTEKAEELRIVSRYMVEQFNINPFDFVLEIYTNDLPFAYRGDDIEDLAPYRKVQHPEDAPAIREWLRPFLDAQGRGKSLDVLLALNESVAREFGYGRREEPGIQPPAETLATRGGSCRDFALLFMEAARHLGLAARYVSGYLCSMDDDQPDIASNATHAWTEIYLPGAGWKGFDPTCGILAAGLHVRVAATRNPAQATPIRGSYLGDASLFAEHGRQRPGSCPRQQVRRRQALLNQDSLIADQGRLADQSLRAAGLTLTQGGEPTFVPHDTSAPEWNIAALGPEKLLYARRLARETGRHALQGRRHSSVLRQAVSRRTAATLADRRLPIVFRRGPLERSEPAAPRSGKRRSQRLRNAPRSLSLDSRLRLALADTALPAYEDFEAS